MGGSRLGAVERRLLLDPGRLLRRLLPEPGRPAVPAVPAAVAAAAAAAASSSSSLESRSEESETSAAALRCAREGSSAPPTGPPPGATSPATSARSCASTGGKAWWWWNPNPNPDPDPDPNPNPNLREHGREGAVLQQLRTRAHAAAAHGEQQVAEALLPREGAGLEHRAHRALRRAARVQRGERGRRRCPDGRGRFGAQRGQAERDRLERVGGGGEDLSKARVKRVSSASAWRAG